MLKLILPVAAIALAYAAFASDAVASVATKGISTKKGRMVKLWDMYRDLLYSESTRLGIPVSTSAAIIAVESSGSPYGSDGRLTIRFEDHIFRKISKDTSFHESNGSQKKEYEVLDKAIAINRDAAFQSISMGVGQIMGFNYELVGFDSAEDMFNSFQYSDKNQIVAMFKFIEKNKNGVLVNAARDNDFQTFAYYYNGPEYKTGKYDSKLADAKQEFINAVGIV